MKKLYLLLLFVSMSFVSAFAQQVSFTDDNGATWTFNHLTSWDAQSRQSIPYAASLYKVTNYGDEIIVPANTYIASILAISENGCTPVLVEPDINTYNINPD